MPQPRSTSFATLEDNLRQLPPTPYHAIQNSAMRFPERSALTFVSSGHAGSPQLTFSYREFIGAIHQIANALRALNVGPDSVVTIMLPNLAEHHLLFWGGQVAGVANPVNPLLEAEHLIGLMRSAGSKVLVTLAPTGKSDLWEKASGLSAAVPSLTHLIAVDPFHIMRPSPPLPETPVPAAYLHDVMGQQATTLSFTPSNNPQKVCALFHTGGTTGRPKLAQHTHENQVFDAWTASLPVSMNEEDVLLCGLPLFHVNGLIVTGLAPLMTGAHVILATAQGYREPSVLPSFWALVERHGVTSFSGVPSVYAKLLNVPTVGYNLSSLRYAICGAAPMPPALLQAFEERTGLTILEGYGLTEGTCVSTVNPPKGKRKIGSIGIPLPYHQIRIAILEKEGRYERDAEVDEVGLLLLHGLNVIPGYVEAAHNTRLWVQIGEERWLNTGDLARFDEDGALFLAGRRKELIIRGGHNIDPLLIEEVLLRHPAVALAAAVGRPDTYSGELPVAYVELKPNANATEAELLDFAAKHISERPAVPKFVRIMPSLPVTEVGKIFKPHLVWEEVRDEFTRALNHAEIAASVQVGQDYQHSTVATVTLNPKQFQQARALLELYAIPFKLDAEE